LYDAFPNPYYYGLPFLSVKVLVAILALFPAASSVYDEPCRVTGKMRPVVKRKGYCKTIESSETISLRIRITVHCNEVYEDDIYAERI